MVHLNRIYTRTGDQGETGIGDGSRVSKLDPRVVAGGSVDELNSHLGVASAHCSSATTSGVLQKLQQHLFDFGADVTCPWNPDATADRCPRIAVRHIEWLENQIDCVNAHLSPLNSFVLPGGSPLASFLHVARSVCRRAERDVLTLQKQQSINPSLLIFLNRLSDLLFVLARDANAGGTTDVLWVPDSQS